MVFFPEPFDEADPSPIKVTLMIAANALTLVWIMVPMLDRRRLGVHDRVADTKVVAL